MLVGATYKTRLTKKECVAEGTMAFYFEKPSDFFFKPGQYVDVTLVNPEHTDEEGNIRSFSIASTPADPFLMLVTRMRDTAFKRSLDAMLSKNEILFDGPFGYFTLHHNAVKPAVLLAGGIGIAPFVSMVRNAARLKSAHHIYLFYSNRRPEDAAFLQVLKESEKENPGFQLIPTMTAMNGSQQVWSGETGAIDDVMLDKYLPALRGPIYYIAGPPAMVAAMQEALASGGVDKDDVISEDFVGY